MYYFKSIKINETGFFNIEETKEYMPFIGLSNGSYTVCYYKHSNNETTILRPNPNAKKIYTALDYKEMAKIWG